MAHYAQISNEEFTAEQRQKLKTAHFELEDIKNSNQKSKSIQINSMNMYLKGLKNLY